jgi:peptide/nickel transport system permease protein
MTEPAAAVAADFEQTTESEARGYWSRAATRFGQNRVAVVSAVALVVMCVAGLLASKIAPYGYQDLNVLALSQSPSRAHLFGTDGYGRDYLSRVLFGIGTSVKVGMLVGVIATLFGTLLGAVAGYYATFTDELLMRLTDLLLTLPVLPVALVAGVFLHANTPLKAALVLACLLWTSVARIVRGVCLSLRQKEFVESARASGASDMRIIVRHLLPNAIPSIAVAATLMIATAVVLEVTLAYLGFGVTRVAGSVDAQASLGDILRQAENEGLYNWWGVTLPGLPIVVLVLSMNFVGDALRDALDPATHTRSTGPRSRIGRMLRGTLRPVFMPLRVGARLLGDARDRLPRVSLPSLDLPALPVRRERPRTRGRAARGLAVQAIGVVLLVGVAGALVYKLGVHHTASPWATAGSSPVNVSHARGAQTEVAVAVEPVTGRNLLAVSNDSLETKIRVYTSTDGGRSWVASFGPAAGSFVCAKGDPAAAIGARGRQYIAFIERSDCGDGVDLSPYLVVAARPGPAGHWLLRRVAPPAIHYGFDDRPAIAVARGGRVYVAWSRQLAPARETTVLSSSVDGGKTWSAPAPVSAQLSYPQLVSVTAGANGTVALAGVDARGIWLARSTDSGRHFTLRVAGRIRPNDAATCMRTGRYLLAQQSIRCLGPNPAVSLAGGRMFVTYGTTGQDGAWDVRVSVFDRQLRRLSDLRVGPPRGRKPADRFWPAAAVDAASGLLWVCFYDTTGDPSRERAWFSCTHSRDGRRWGEPVRVARDSADSAVLWEDSRLFGYQDPAAYGGYTGLAAHAGTVHPMWIDTSDLGGRSQEIFASRMETRP